MSAPSKLRRPGPSPWREHSQDDLPTAVWRPAITVGADMYCRVVDNFFLGGG